VPADDGMEFAVAELAPGRGIAGLGSHDLLHLARPERSSLPSRRGSENRGSRPCRAVPWGTAP
jgi:hypothetical protein